MRSVALDARVRRGRGPAIIGGIVGHHGAELIVGDDAVAIGVDEIKQLLCALARAKGDLQLVNGDRAVTIGVELGVCSAERIIPEGRGAAGASSRLAQAEAGATGGSSNSPKKLE